MEILPPPPGLSEEDEEYWYEYTDKARDDIYQSLGLPTAEQRAAIMASHEIEAELSKIARAKTTKTNTVSKRNALFKLADLNLNAAKRQARRETIRALDKSAVELRLGHQIPAGPPTLAVLRAIAACLALDEFCYTTPPALRMNAINFLANPADGGSSQPKFEQIDEG